MGVILETFFPIIAREHVFKMRDFYRDFLNELVAYFNLEEFVILRREKKGVIKNFDLNILNKILASSETEILDFPNFLAKMIKKQQNIAQRIPPIYYSRVINPDETITVLLSLATNLTKSSYKILKTIKGRKEKEIRKILEEQNHFFCYTVNLVAKSDYYHFEEIFILPTTDEFVPEEPRGPNVMGLLG